MIHLAFIAQDGKVVLEAGSVSTYADGFTAGFALLHFTRGANGDFSPPEGSARVERVHFRRVK